MVKHTIKNKILMIQYFFYFISMIDVVKHAIIDQTRISLKTHIINHKKNIYEKIVNLEIKCLCCFFLL